jgi:hypothetical protein
MAKTPSTYSDISYSRTYPTRLRILPEKSTDTRLPSKPRGTTKSRKKKEHIDDLFDGIESDGDGEAELAAEPSSIKLEHRSACFFMFSSRRGAKHYIRAAGSEGIDGCFILSEAEKYDICSGTQEQ